MDNDIKFKIEKVVSDYKNLFPDEYRMCVQSNKHIQETRETKFAEMKGSDYIERLLFIIPVNLFDMIKAQLSDEEFKYYDSKEGGRWFASTYKEFRAGEKI